MSARGRACADAQGRCDGAGSEEIGSPQSSRTRLSVREDYGFHSPASSSARCTSAFVQSRTSNPHFFGEVSRAEALGFKREDRPAAFAGRSESFLSFLCPLGYQSCLYGRVSYPARTHSAVRFHPLRPKRNPGNQPENILRISAAKIVARYNVLRFGMGSTIRSPVTSSR